MLVHLEPFPSFTRAMSHSVSPDLTVYVLPAGAVVVSRFCVTVAFLVVVLLSLFLNSIDLVWYGAYYSNSIFAMTSTP